MLNSNKACRNTTCTRHQLNKELNELEVRKTELTSLFKEHSGEKIYDAEWL